MKVPRDLVTVYIALLGEGVDVWRPVQAEHAGGDLYQLTGEPPDDEVWTFAVGDVVRRNANFQRRRKTTRARARRVREINTRVAVDHFGNFMKPRQGCHCDQGWICENHPEQPWPHPTSEEADGHCAGQG